MFIRSERLFLRPGWPEDWEELRRRINNSAVVCQLVAAQARLLGPLTGAHKRHFPQFLITLPGGDGSQLIGYVRLVGGLLCGEHGAELVYWISPEFWGQGYATEAARAVLRLARTLGHRQIAATHFADNMASDRVLAKLGFQATGETVDRLCLGSRALAESRVRRRDLGERSDCDGYASGSGGDATRHAA